MRIDRVFLDTNVLISGLIFRRGNEAALLEMAGQGLVQIVLSSWVIKEAREVFEDKFTERMHVLEDFLAAANYQIAPEPGESDLRTAAGLVRDPDDVPVLAAALASNSDVVLSGDKHLLADAVRQSMRVCRCADYLFQREETED